MRGTAVASSFDMRFQRYVYGLGLGVGIACGGVSAPSNLERTDAATSAGGTESSLAHPPAPRVPAKHRASAASCDDQRPSGNARPYESQPCTQDSECASACSDNSCRAACLDYGEGPVCASAVGDCLRDADCTAGANGRCNNNREYWTCSYDQCFSDAACTSGGPCACEGESGALGNACLPGNCQTDADCGNAGYCSPTFGGCGNYSGVIAYYCHTRGDACVDDSDCVSPEQAGYCMYSPEVGHWACGYGQCVG
jgi:hypothetical protein